MLIRHLLKELDSIKCKSAWDKAVALDAYTLIEDFPSDYDYVGSPCDHKKLLNGAENWKEYSYGGCALCYDHDIAKHYCTPSELKKTKEGMRNPNSQETWLDVQARALYQAENLINRIAKDRKPY